MSLIFTKNFIQWRTFHLTPFFSHDHTSQTSQIAARSVEVTEKEVKTVPNLEAILQDFQLLGKGVVKSVEARTEKWSF